MLRTDARTSAAALAEFCAGIQWSSVPAIVHERTQELVLDLVGVALRGSRAPSSAPVVAVARRLGPGKGASLIGGDAVASAPWAAPANAPSAHCPEMGDVPAR